MIAQSPMEDTEPSVQRSSMGHNGKLLWDRKIRLAGGFVFLRP